MIRNRLESVVVKYPWIMLIVLSLIWGSSYILIKRGLDSFTPVQLASLRVTISALAFLPFLPAQLKKISKKEIPFFIAVGICGSTVPAFLFSTAQTQITSSLASILNSLTPIFTLLLGILLFKQSFQREKALGIGVGLVGAVILLAFGSDSHIDGSFGYGMLVVLAALLYATNANLVATYLYKHSAITISSISFTFVGLPVAYILFSGGFINVMQTVPGAWASLTYVAILSVFGTVIATVMFFWLIRRTSAIYGSTIAYLIPVVGIMWGIIDGEKILVWHILGLLLVLSGVYLTSRKKKPII